MPRYFIRILAAGEKTEVRVLAWLFHPVFLLLLLIAFVLFYYNQDVLSERERPALDAAVIDSTSKIGVSPATSAGAAPEKKAPAVSIAVDSLEESKVSTMPVESQSIKVDSPKIQEELGVTQASTQPEINDKSNDLLKTVTEGDDTSEEAVDAGVNSEVPESGEDTAIVVTEAKDGGTGESITAETPTDVTNNMPTAISSPAVEAGTTEVSGTELQGDVGSIKENAVLPSAESTPREVWIRARSEVWAGNLDDAISDYRSLIALQPNNFDAHGELGNVLLAQGLVEEALDAYSQAARLLHQGGEPRQTWHLLRFISATDPQRGAQLQNELSGQ